MAIPPNPKGIGYPCYIYMNSHKDMILKEIWFKQKEYKKLKDALNEGDNTIVLDIIYEIYQRKDL